MANIYNFETKQDNIAIVRDFYKVIEEMKVNSEISFILDTELAYLLQDFIEESNLEVENHFELDFGNLTGKCLLSIFKTNDTFEVVVEDVSREVNGGIEIKHHEGDTLVVFEEDYHLARNYDMRKVIVIIFGKELGRIEELLTK